MSFDDFDAQTQSDEYFDATYGENAADFLDFDDEKTPPPRSEVENLALTHPDLFYPQKLPYEMI